jgi:hypothetical protein
MDWIDLNINWEELLNATGVLLAAAGLALVWLLTLRAAWADVSRRRLPWLERLFWLAVVTVLPLVGYAVFGLARRLEAGMLAPLTAAPVAGIRPRPMREVQTMVDPPAERVLPTQPGAQVSGGRLRVLVAAGPHEGMALNLTVLPVTVGRGDGATLRLMNDGAISRQHAEIYNYEGELRIRDLGSRHGTQVNHEPVQDAPLRAGDKVQIGSSVLLIQQERAA